MEITFEFEKETKNTYRYTEQPEAGQPPKVGSLYVQKWALPTRPVKLNVTIEEVNVETEDHHRSTEHLQRLWERSLGGQA